MLSIVLLQDFFKCCWLFSGILLSARPSPFWNQSNRNFWVLWFAGSIKFFLLLQLTTARPVLDPTIITWFGYTHPLSRTMGIPWSRPYWGYTRTWLVGLCCCCVLPCADILFFYFHIYCFYEGTREDSFLRILHYCHILAIRNSKWSFKSVNQTM